MIIYMACYGMMQEAYSEALDRFNMKIPELRSYWELYGFSGHTMPKFGKPFMLDSGAFSAWSQNDRVTPEKFVKWVKKYETQIDGGYANIDDITKRDSNGRVSKEALQVSAEGTLKNQRFLEDNGIRPIPVFHKGEPWSFLEYYLEHYDYICLGGLASDDAISDNKAFFDEVWPKYLTNSDGTPKVKVHAFGMTSLDLMKAYPWYSCDSSTWLIQAKTGQIMIPKTQFGKQTYEKKGELISISDNASARSMHGYHFETLPAAEKEYVRKYLKEELDLTPEIVASHAKWRMVCNLYFWRNVMDKVNWCKAYKTRQIELI